MATEEILARIDRTLDRIDARIERSDRRWEEDRSRWEEDRIRSDEERTSRDEEWRTEREEMRAFMDSLTRRHVAVTQEMIVGLRAFQVEVVAELSDQRAALNANTQAVLRLLDERFGPERPQG